MTPRIEELKAIERAATKGPWGWRVNIKAKAVRLESPKWCVMSFDRWGMSQATPLFLTDGFMKKAVELAEVIPGREHHASWELQLNHPDATFITEARTAMPELIAEVESLRQQRDELLDELKDLVEINNWTPKSWETRLRVLRNIIQRCEVKV